MLDSSWDFVGGRGGEEGVNARVCDVVNNRRMKV